MKYFIYLLPLFFGSCMTQSDYINLGVATTMITVSTQVEDIRENIQERKEQRKEKREENK